MGRRDKPWFRPDIGWWVTNVGGKQFRLAKGKKRERSKAKAEAQRAFHELMALRPQRPDCLQCPRLRLGGSLSGFRPQEEVFCGHHSELRLLPDELLPDVPGILSRPERSFRNDVTNWLMSPKDDKTPRVWNDTTEYNAKRYAFRLFSWATEEGLLAKNPLKGLKREKPETKRRCLTEPEYCSLLRGARRPFRLFLWALMETGARPSELRRLKWNEVRENTFVIEKHKTAKKTGKTA